MSEDARDQLYHDLHHNQLAGEEAHNRRSAQKILRLLFRYVHPGSMLDVGCGLGTWLAEARALGVADVRGVDGAWLDRALLRVDPELVTVCDLEAGFDLGRRFDLVVSLEVAEHLSESAADRFVASLAAHGDVVLFSAAIPFQGGHHHVNERFPDYWAERFIRFGFSPVDLIRGRIWHDPEVIWWLRQNILLFAHERALAVNERLAGEERDARGARPLAIVHPEVYVARLQELTRRVDQNQEVLRFLAQGGTFSASRSPDGQLKLVRLA